MIPDAEGRKSQKKKRSTVNCAVMQKPKKIIIDHHQKILVSFIINIIESVFFPSL